MDGRLVVLKRFVEALGEPADISSIDARKRFQKAVYLGQLSGVDLGYRYGWYVRGPYSTSLTRDYYALSSAIEAGDQPPDDTTLKPNVAQRLAAIRPLLTVPPDVQLETSDWYELLASWHYLSKVSRKTSEQATETMQREKVRLVPYIARANQVLQENHLL
jgi:uncharacterized protein YwgA